MGVGVPGTDLQPFRVAKQRLGIVMCSVWRMQAVRVPGDKRQGEQTDESREVQVKRGTEWAFGGSSSSKVFKTFIFTMKAVEDH